MFSKGNKKKNFSTVYSHFGKKDEIKSDFDFRIIVFIFTFWFPKTISFNRRIILQILFI